MTRRRRVEIDSLLRVHVSLQCWETWVFNNRTGMKWNVLLLESGVRFVVAWQDTSLHVTIWHSSNSSVWDCWDGWKRVFFLPLKYLRRGWISSFPLNNIWKEKRRVEHHQLLEPVDFCQLLRRQRERKPKQFSELSTSSGVCLFGIPNNIPLNFIRNWICESAALRF